MKSFAVVALSLALGIGLVNFLVNTYLFYRQFLTRSEPPFRGHVPLKFHSWDRNANRNLFLVKLPIVLFTCLTWPAFTAWAWVLALKSKMGFARAFSDKGKPLKEKILRETRNYVIPLLGSTVVILLVFLSLSAESVRPILLVWLSCVWISLFLRLLTAYLPQQSFSVWVRSDPRYLKRNAASLLFLFGAVFPVVASTISSLTSSARTSLSEILSSAAGIYLLGGILWEGPKNVLPELLTQPVDLLLFGTGSMLYFVIGTKAIPALVTPVSDSELRMAATERLMFGDAREAGLLLDRISADDRDTWHLRIICLITQGQLDKAKSICALKLPEVGDYGNSFDLVAAEYFLYLSLQWQTPEEVQRLIWRRLVEAEPSEEELLALWLAISILNHSYPCYSDAQFLEYAEPRGYIDFKFAVATSRKKDEVIGLYYQVLNRCSISSATSAFVQGILLAISIEQKPTETEAQTLAYLDLLAEAIARTERLSGIILVGSSLVLVNDRVAKDSAIVADRVQEIYPALREKVLLLPHGQAILALIQGHFS